MSFYSGYGSKPSQSSFASLLGGASAATTAWTKDAEVSEPPGDSISSLSFSPIADFLAVGSWNNEVRIYEVNSEGGQTRGKAMYRHQGSVLGVCWNKEGNKVISCGADNAARMYDLATGQSSQVAQHDAPIKCVRWFESPQGGIVATGSWDKTLKYWDTRSSTPIATVQLPERCYSMDVVYPLLVVGTAERHIQIYNLTNPTVPYRTQTSPLKMQTRVVTCFPSADGYATGSIEGRVAIHFVDDARTGENYTFRCHRKEQGLNKNQTDVYSVNDINFHPVHGTFSTSGSDGVIHFWDKDARSRLKTLDVAPGPIAATTFNRDGRIFAYAVSYDWSKGYSGMTANHPNKVMLHPCKEDEVKRRKK
ncbi:poly RNA export protein [Fomitiporia mediterranea MF3/22]|uniref:poly RNA export protein n=1 Tax=Fomitiporia mediterranea (strain MF3/22) TaxID=694068 RepID=UPI00044083C0|nr:poly RNA export protein [Fomitiporia mediterranea MF3/22]EJD07000.1 poly RNA export protein [Fomitiporia mediterranea MF3/22]